MIHVTIVPKCPPRSRIGKRPTPVCAGSNQDVGGPTHEIQRVSQMLIEEEY